MVDGKQQHGLNELGLGHRTPHHHNGLTGEDGHALFHTPHIAGKFKMGQVIQEFFAETTFAPQIVQIALGEAQVGKILHQLLHTGHDSITGVIRHVAVEHVKIGDGIAQPLLVVPIGHGELVKIRQHGQIFFYIQKSHLLFLDFWRQSRPFFGCRPLWYLLYLHHIW